MYLIANKRDLESRREISEEMGTDLATKLRAEFCEVSALTDSTGVLTLFEQMAKRASEELLSSAKQGATLVDEPKEEKSECC
jgi:hypothetical protein